MTEGAAKPNLARLPTADELAMLREVYAETYPVRPLLNEIGRLTAELTALRGTPAAPPEARRIAELLDVATPLTDEERGSAADTLRGLGALYARVNDLERQLDAAEERSKACDQIADGDYGWEKLEPLCVATMSVCRLRSNYERARAALSRLLELKDYKTRHGKNGYYNAEQPEAWAQAREALAGVRGQTT